MATGPNLNQLSNYGGGFGGVNLSTRDLGAGDSRAGKALDTYLSDYGDVASYVDSIAGTADSPYSRAGIEFNFMGQNGPTTIKGYDAAKDYAAANGQLFDKDWSYYALDPLSERRALGRDHYTGHGMFEDRVLDADATAAWKAAQQPGASDAPSGAPAAVPAPSGGGGADWYSGGGGGAGSGGGNVISAIGGPQRWNVDRNQTVAGQLETILASDSPLMQQARTRAMQAAAREGRLNTSMAGTGGEAALIDAAMDIARPDADRYGAAAQSNAEAENVFTRDANAFTRDRDNANFNLNANDWAAQRDFDRQMARDRSLDSMQAAREAADRQFRSGEAAADRVFRLGEAGADRAFRSGESALDRAAQIQRDESANAFTLRRDETGNANQVSRENAAEQATVRRGYMNSINDARSQFASRYADINANPNIGAEAKAETIRGLVTTYNTLISNYASLLGWTAKDWLIDSDDMPGGPAPAPAPGMPGSSEYVPDYGGSGM